MQVAPIPANEAARLKALHVRLILGTPPEQCFDKITRDNGSEMALIEPLRQGKTLSLADTRVVIMVGQCSEALAQELHACGVSKIILRPFKVKTLLSTIQEFFN